MKLSKEQIDILKNIIQDSIKQLYANDKPLITRGGMEPSISFHFAIYLLDSIRKIGWLNAFQLDIEYNKNGFNPKKTPRRPNGVKPDLIIHNRGNNNSNILVIEIKGWWNSEPRENDQIKLEDFTSQDGEYKYGLGVFLELGKDGCQPEYFIDYEL